MKDGEEERAQPGAGGTGRQATFAITVSFELAEDDLGEFHRLVSENAALSMKLEPGCLRFDVLVPVDGAPPHEILLYEIYADRAAFDRHLESAHYRNFDRISRRLVRRKTVLAFHVSEHFKEPSTV